MNENYVGNKIVQVFENKQFGEIRVIKENEEPWFVAKDLCQALDLEWQGAKTLTALNPHWFVGREIPDSLGRMQRTFVINEAGVYKLIFRSRKEEAEKFTNWIAEEVLPEIRKTGQYSVQKPASQLDILRSAIDQIEAAQEIAVEAKQIATDTNNRIENIKDIIINTDLDWRKWVNNQISKLVNEDNRLDKDYRYVRRLSYSILENRGRCRLSVRLLNLKERLEMVGATSTEIKKANKLDVVESDVRLKEIYSGIIKDLVIKYSA
jgi:prophage antirepressor-like protein